jgi:hypothetical protein
MFLPFNFASVSAAEECAGKIRRFANDRVGSGCGIDRQKQAAAVVETAVDAKACVSGCLDLNVVDDSDGESGDLSDVRAVSSFLRGSVSEMDSFAVSQADRIDQILDKRLSGVGDVGHGKSPLSVLSTATVGLASARVTWRCSNEERAG